MTVARQGIFLQQQERVMDVLSAEEKVGFLQSLETMSDEQLEMLNDRVADNRPESDWKRRVVEAEMVWRDNHSTGVRPHFTL